MTREFSQIGTQWEKNSGFVQVQSSPSFSSGGKITERGERGMGAEGEGGWGWGRWKRVLRSLSQVDGREGGRSDSSRHPRGAQEKGRRRGFVSHAEPRHSCKTPACKIVVPPPSPHPPTPAPSTPAPSTPTPIPPQPPNSPSPSPSSSRFHTPHPIPSLLQTPSTGLRHPSFRSGRVWRKVPEGDARSVSLLLSR